MSKVVLVTGSSKGLGSEIIKKYAKNGYNVVINYNKDKISAEKLKDFVEKNYKVEALVVKADVSVEEEVINMISTIVKKFNQIDVVVNNAAIELSTEIKDKNASSFRKVLDTNLIGTFLVSKYASVEMLKRESGNIINISSNNGIDAFDPYTMEYDASKAAVINLTKNLAKEFSPYINVNCVAPGWIKTEKVMELDKELNGMLIKEESKKILLKRFAEKEEIANVVYFLSSKDATYINGTIIRVDGGY